MSKNVKKVPITFNRGYSSRKGVLGMIAVPDKIPIGTPYCLLYFYTNDQWVRFATVFEIIGRSIAFIDSEKAWWILGEKGEAIRIAGSEVEYEQIPGTGLFGYGPVYAIKNIAGDLYACGNGRQVYCRQNGRWESIAGDIVTHNAYQVFFDIDGVDKEHIYAVGMEGEIYFYNGSEWKMDKLPVKAWINSVRCTTSDEVWIAGFKNTVIHGRFNNWEVIGEVDTKTQWYCIEEYGGKIYLAGDRVLATIEDGKIQKFNPGQGKRRVTTGRLHTKDGLLWSIGEKDVLVFDGSSWKAVPHPENL